MRGSFQAINTIQLLPDEKLLKELEEARRQRTTSSTARAGDRGSRRQNDRRLEAIKRELKDRGLDGPPWWSQV
ncbi:MAG: hypothetical protein WD423_00540 [Rhodothermales bacterium]